MRALSCFGGLEGLRMCIQWQILKDEAHPIAKRFSDFLEGRTDPPAKWSLKVGELDDLHSGARRTLYRVGRRDGDFLPRRFQEPLDRHI